MCRKIPIRSSLSRIRMLRDLARWYVRNLTFMAYPLINTPKKIDVKVTYSTISQPTVTRTLKKSHIVNVSLPIAVNVEDFFRGKRFFSKSIGLDPLYISNLFHRLFSKFTISTTTRQHVRLSSADLQGPSSHGLDGVNITKYRSSQAMMVSQVFERCHMAVPTLR